VTRVVNLNMGRRKGSIHTLKNEEEGGETTTESVLQPDHRKHANDRGDIVR